MTAPAQTLTPQNAFPLVGSLEDADTVAAIGKLLLNEEYGLKQICADDQEKWLCRRCQARLDDYPHVQRQQWARLKELCLLNHGAPIAAAIDTMCSDHRTPAIAEAAIRATGDKIYQAAERHGDSCVVLTRQLFRRIMASVIPAPTDEELAV